MVHLTDELGTSRRWADEVTTTTYRSCLLHRFVKNEWRVLSSQTIGVEFATKIIKVGTGARRKRIKLQVRLSSLLCDLAFSCHFNDDGFPSAETDTTSFSPYSSGIPPARNVSDPSPGPTTAAPPVPSSSTT